MKKPSLLYREENGSVLVIVALSMTVFMGFAALVIDVGSLYLERARLMDTADAAALAGAQGLRFSETEAKKVAEEYVVKNGEELNDFTVFVGDDPDDTYSEPVVKVTANTDVDFFFARVLGINTGSVGARAVATARPAATASGVVPVGINKELKPEYGKLVELKITTDHDDLMHLGSANFGALDLDGESGGGASDYEKRIKEGYEGTLQIGSIITPESGNMVGPTDAGLQHRLDGCEHEQKCIIGNYKDDCTRVVLVPVYEIDKMQNENKVETMKIVGFAAFLLYSSKEDESTVNESGESESGMIKGYFLENVTVSGDSDPGALDYGVYAIKLIE